LTGQAQGPWTERFQGLIEGLRLEGRDGETVEMVGGIDRIQVKGHSRGRDLGRFADLQHKWQGLVSGSELDEERLGQEMFATLKEVMGLLEEFGSETTVQGVRLQLPVQFGLDRCGMAARMAPSGEGTRSLGASFEFSGLALGDGVPAPRDLVPTDARLELVLDKLPGDLFSRLLGLGEQAVTQADGAALQQQGMAMLMQMRPEIAIRRSHVTLPIAKIALDLLARFDPTAKFMATGRWDIRGENLDALIAKAREMGMGGEAEQMISMVLAFSQRTNEGQKVVVDTFKGEVTPDGRVMLNGKDITGLFFPAQNGGGGK